VTRSPDQGPTRRATSRHARWNYGQAPWNCTGRREATSSSSFGERRRPGGITRADAQPFKTALSDREAGLPLTPLRGLSFAPRSSPPRHPRARQLGQCGGGGLPPIPVPRAPQAPTAAGQLPDGPGPTATVRGVTLDRLIGVTPGRSFAGAADEPGSGLGWLPQPRPNCPSCHASHYEN
jgi:hypothetical protein